MLIFFWIQPTDVIKKFQVVILDSFFMVKTLLHLLSIKYFVPTIAIAFIKVVIT